MPRNERALTMGGLEHESDCQWYIGQKRDILDMINMRKENCRKIEEMR